MKHRIELTARAQADLQEAYQYIYILHIRHAARQFLTPEEIEGLSHEEA